mgnify:CR=1 FL=1
MKYKATINIDRDKWDKYIARCKELGSNGSKEFEKFLDCFIEGKTYKYETEADWVNLPEAVKVFEEILVERVLLRLEYAQAIPKREEEGSEWKNGKSKTPTKTDGQTDISVESRLNKKGIAQSGTKNLEVSGKTDTQTDAQAESLKSSSNSKQKDSTKTKTEVSASPYVFDDSLEDWARQTFTDQAVADIEGASIPTINRRRTGARKSEGNSFWTRWEVSTLNENRWWKKESADFSVLESKKETD